MRAATFAALMLATASPAIVNNTAVAQVQRPTKIASTILVTVNGQQLTQSMVDSAIEFGEYLAGHKFTAADKRWYRDIKIKSFRSNPVAEMQGYRVFGQKLSKMKQLRDPVQLAEYRENYIANLYLSLLANNRVNSFPIMTMVYKYSPVLYANPKYKIVVSKRTVDSLIASRNFVAKLAGKPLMPIDYNYWAQDLRRSGEDFASPQIRKSFATAESRWVRLQQAWSNTPPQGRHKAIAFINKNLQRGYKVHNIARELEDIANGENTAANGSNTMSQFNSDMQKIDYFRRMMAY
jgi:hypothetical protein